MKRKKKAQAVLIFLFFLLSVLVCLEPVYSTGNASGKWETSGRENRKHEITINYYIWENEESYVRPVIEAYEALNPGIYVNLHAVGQDLYDDSLENIVAGEARVDLVGVRETSHMVSLAEKGYLLDLTPYISEHDLEIEAYGNMFNEIGINGRYYGIPTRSTCWILLYNKDLFDAAGVEYPGQLTWQEYRQLAADLTAEEDGIPIYGGYWPPWCFNFLAIQNSSYLIDDDLEMVRDSLETLNNIYNVDHSHVNYYDTANQTEKLSSLFAQGKIAMMPQGEWIINMLLEDEKEGTCSINWGIAPIPVPTLKKAGTTWGQYQFACICADTRYPEEVFDFLSFLCGEEAAGIYAANGIIPAYSSDEIWEIYAAAIGENIAEVFRSAKRNQEQLAIPRYHELSEKFKQCAHAYLIGECSIGQAMKEFEKQRMEIYEY